MAKHEKAIPTSANLKRLYPVITAEELLDSVLKKDR